MDDITTLCVTLFILVIMFLYIAIVAKFKYAYKKRFELIYRGGIPVLIFATYQVFIALLGYNLFSLLSGLGVLANAAMAWKLYNDDSFLADVICWKPLGRRSLFLYYYLEMNDELDANVFQNTKHSTSFQTVIKIVEDNKLDQKTREQFETDEKWEQYMKFKAAYDANKAEADTLRVEVLAFTSILSGFKMLLYVHKGPLSEHVLEGNCIIATKDLDIEGRKFEKIVCWEGPEGMKTQQRMEASADYLDILSSLVLLESIPNMEAQLAKKDELLEKQRDVMRKMKADTILAEESIKYDQPNRTAFDMRRFGLYILGAILGVAIPILILVFMLAFGAI